MRESVAEVGVAGSTFARVSAKAGVSRGLLHYYFHTKERLLIEVIRRDTERRIAALGEAMAAAGDLDELVEALMPGFERDGGEDGGYLYMVSELLVAARHNPGLLRELGAVLGRARAQFAEILRERERAGIVRLRFDAESVIDQILAARDGAAVRHLADPALDREASARAEREVARFLLTGG